MTAAALGMRGAMTADMQIHRKQVPTSKLVERVLQRRDELQRGLVGGSASPSTRADIEAALTSLGALLTGDPAQLPSTIKGALARWLESNRYLGVRADAAASVAPPPRSEDGPVAAGTPPPVA